MNVSNLSSAIDCFSTTFTELNFFPTMSRGSKCAAVASCVGIVALTIFASSRIFNIATVVAGGIGPLSVGALFCGVLAYCQKPLIDFTSVESRQKANEPDPARAISGNLPPLSQEGMEALSFSFKMLEQHPNMKPTVFKASYDETGKRTYQPINQQIARLRTLYIEFHKTLEKAVEKNMGSNPWSQKEVIDAADACIKISFAIGVLTLEDLPAFVQLVARKEKEAPRTYAIAVSEQCDSYQYRTFYFCSFAYRNARFSKTYIEEVDRLIYDYEEVPAEQIALFKTAGTVQNNWYKLYNEYCARTRMYISEEDLMKADPRHARWTTQDTGQDFLERPDRIPT